MRAVRLLVAGVCLAGCLSVAGSPSAAQTASDACRIMEPAAGYAQQVALSAGHARVWRLYQAFFLRQPDRDGFDHWYGVRARGAHLSDIAYAFAASSEFQQRYGNVDHDRFVDLVYGNVCAGRPTRRAVRTGPGS